MKISVVTVSFNSFETIKSTIESLESQLYDDYEYIVIDGGSTDHTLDVVNSFSNVVTKCLSEPDDGIYDAMNKGIQLASGDVIGILNSDDFYLNDHVLSDVADVFSADPKLDLVLGDVDFVHNNDLCVPVRHYKAGKFKPWMFRFGLMPPHPAIFVRKSAYHRVGLYKMGYKIAADFELLIRLMFVDRAKYKVVNKTWVRMRTGGVSTSGLKSVLTITQEMERSLLENDLYTNKIMLFFRLPIKLFTQVLWK